MKKYISIVIGMVFAAGIISTASAQVVCDLRNGPPDPCPEGIRCPSSHPQCDTSCLPPGATARCSRSFGKGMVSVLAQPGTQSSDEIILMARPAVTASNPSRVAAPALGSRAAALRDAVASRSAGRPAPSAVPSRVAASSAARVTPSSFSGPSARPAVAALSAIPSYMRTTVVSVSASREAMVSLVGSRSCEPDGSVKQEVNVTLANAYGSASANSSGGYIGGHSQPPPASFRFSATAPIIFRPIIGGQYSPRSSGHSVVVTVIDSASPNSPIISNYGTKGNRPPVVAACPIPCYLITDPQICSAIDPSTDQARCRWDTTGMGGPGGIGPMCVDNRP